MCLVSDISPLSPLPLLPLDSSLRPLSPFQVSNLHHVVSQATSGYNSSVQGADSMSMANGGGGTSATTEPSVSPTETSP